MMVDSSYFSVVFYSGSCQDELMSTFLIICHSFSKPDSIPEGNGSGSEHQDEQDKDAWKHVNIYEFIDEQSRASKQHHDAEISRWENAVKNVDT